MSSIKSYWILPEMDLSQYSFKRLKDIIDVFEAECIHRNNKPQLK